MRAGGDGDVISWLRSIRGEGDYVDDIESIELATKDKGGEGGVSVSERVVSKLDSVLCGDGLVDGEKMERMQEIEELVGDVEGKGG